MVKKRRVGEHIYCRIISLCGLAGPSAKRLPSGKLCQLSISHSPVNDACCLLAGGAIT